jgi:hypothetical protein
LKTFVLKEKPQTLLGKPFRIPDIEAAVKEGEPPPILENPDIKQLLALLVFNIPMDRLTMQDSVEAALFVQQLRSGPDGSFSLEEAEYNWIKGIVETHASHIFGVNAVVLKNFLKQGEQEKKSA